MKSKVERRLMLGKNEYVIYPCPRCGGDILSKVKDRGTHKDCWLCITDR